VVVGKARGKDCPEKMSSLKKNQEFSWPGTGGVIKREGAFPGEKRNWVCSRPMGGEGSVWGSSFKEMEAGGWKDIAKRNESLSRKYKFGVKSRGGGN